MHPAGLLIHRGALFFLSAGHNEISQCGFVYLQLAPAYILNGFYTPLLNISVNASAWYVQNGCGFFGCKIVLHASLFILNMRRAITAHSFTNICKTASGAMLMRLA